VVTVTRRVHLDTDQPSRANRILNRNELPRALNGRKHQEQRVISVKGFATVMMAVELMVVSVAMPLSRTHA